MTDALPRRPTALALVVPRHGDSSVLTIQPQEVAPPGTG